MWLLNSNEVSYGSSVHTTYLFLFVFGGGSPLAFWRSFRSLLLELLVGVDDGVPDSVLLPSLGPDSVGLPGADRFVGTTAAETATVGYW